LVLISTEIYDKIGKLWDQIDFKASNVEEKFKELDQYMEGVLDIAGEDEDALFLRQFRTNASIIKKINQISKRANERMDNFISTTDRISKRLSALESEITELRKKLNGEGLE